MRLLNLFMVALCAVIGAYAEQSATCWKSGPATSKDRILPKLERVCQNLVTTDVGYLRGEERYICVLDPVDNKVKWDFALTVSQK
jgi:hypothetical protein